MFWIIVPGAERREEYMVWIIALGFLGDISVTLGLSLMLLQSMLDCNEA
jgi:hypothetical protein